MCSVGNGHSRPLDAFEREPLNWRDSSCLRPFSGLAPAGYESLTTTPTLAIQVHKF
nr:MAG TPA: hypothetical protein [Bacteriophage sp.]